MKPTARVAVRDPLPLYRHGVAAALTSEGILVDTPADLLAWAEEGGCRVVIVTLENRSDWTVLKQLDGTRPRPLIIATMNEDSVTASISALRLGADSVVSRRASMETLRRALDGVLAGESLVATSIVRSLVSHVSSAPDEPGSMQAERVEWLRELASGRTVAQLADKAGYSERTMFRILKTMYARMGVTNRTDALMRAQQLGWLPAPDKGEPGYGRGQRIP